ncbi:MAG: hypothetical protein ACI94N_000006 [Candidatus Arcticimaribacter sp.]|jgi:hypothetical protein
MGFSLSRVVPEVRIKSNFFLVTYFYMFGINVKDIFLMHQGAPKDFSVDL